MPEPKIQEKTLTFSVASKLWRELGERLVGRKPIALAELVKNGYDADAQRVTVRVDPKQRFIEVVDDGHGMTWEEFTTYWATVGTTHKEEGTRRSRHCLRPLTGSKGVGRISTRVLADTLILETVSDKHPHMRIRAEVDWASAVNLDLLTETPIETKRETHQQPLRPGTTIRLERLHGDWSPADVRETALEIWKLQPPYPGLRPRGSKCGFEVGFESPDGELTGAFEEALSSIMQLFEARITGSIKSGVAEATLQFGSEKPLTFKHRVGPGALKNAKFEIRHYQLKGRVSSGIKVAEARKYIDEFRGVHIYDSGFRLPYYGQAEADWLELTLDQARRIGQSKLLPDSLQTPEGLLHLPNIYHLLGAVAVNTVDEPELRINIGRDRLVEGPAFEELKNGVRATLDWYAVEKAKRRVIEVASRKETEAPSSALQAVERVIDDLEDKVPPAIVVRLRSNVAKALKSVERREEAHEANLAVLGSLATAGISAVAYQHEMGKQILAIEGLIARLRSASKSTKTSQKDMEQVLKDFDGWIARSRAIGGLFGTFEHAENLTAKDSFEVTKVVAHVLRQLTPLLPGVSVSQAIPPGFEFPPASMAEWSSILQNVILNAANAMQGSKNKRLRFVGGSKGHSKWLLVQDTGSGVDLKESERLFKPFERGAEISEERRKVGFGGTGLGLTIVRLIASQRGCEVSFVEPEKEFSTAFKIEWRS